MRRVQNDKKREVRECVYQCTADLPFQTQTRVSVKRRLRAQIRRKVKDNGKDEKTNRSRRKWVQDKSPVYLINLGSLGRLRRRSTLPSPLASLISAGVRCSGTGGSSTTHKGAA
jgi:hypothetical protein